MNKGDRDLFIIGPVPDHLSKADGKSGCQLGTLQSRREKKCLTIDGFLDKNNLIVLVKKENPFIPV